MAAAALFNPAIVRQIAKDKKEAILPLIEKVNAYMLSLFAIGLIAIWSGALDWLMLRIFNNTDIADALDILEIMAIAGLFLPLFVLSFIFNAEGEEKKLLSYNFIAATVSVAVFLIFGWMGEARLYALGIVSYYAIIALYTYSYLKKAYRFRLSSVTRLIRDIKGMTKGR
jgi:O-antigen/teichoic acid export membrane protein